MNRVIALKKCFSFRLFFVSSILLQRLLLSQYSWYDDVKNYHEKITRWKLGIEILRDMLEFLFKKKTLWKLNKITSKSPRFFFSFFLFFSFAATLRVIRPSQVQKVNNEKKKKGGNYISGVVPFFYFLEKRKKHSLSLFFFKIELCSYGSGSNIFRLRFISFTWRVGLLDTDWKSIAVPSGWRKSEQVDKSQRSPRTN